MIETWKTRDNKNKNLMDFINYSIILGLGLDKKYHNRKFLKNRSFMIKQN